MKPPSHPLSKQKLRDFYSLTKPEVNLLILMTTSAGYYLASRGHSLNIPGLIHTLIGTLLVASGTATLNQYIERVWDGKMRRTANRPLPSGRIGARAALVFGVLLSVAGGLYLALAVNALSGALAITTLFSYLFIYTPLKRATALCTLLGAFPGAMPTLIGWAGAANRIDSQAWILFGILFLWQFPHFLAIALLYRDDYARAGYRMLPDFDRDSRFTRLEILGFTVLLVAVTMLPLAARSGVIYFAAMLLSGSYLLYHVAMLIQSPAAKRAGGVIHASVLYLPIVLATMMVYRG
ncbi:MAG TPA: heme o synthase [Candidatus Sulfotelmatobacter sp.]